MQLCMVMRDMSVYKQHVIKANARTWTQTKLEIVMDSFGKSSIFISLGMILGIFAAASFVYVTVTPCWYVSYAQASISPYENCYGLWSYCSSTGLCGKWLSGSLLGSHGVQRISCRAFMIIACLLCLPALLLNCLGMECILLMQLEDTKKEQLLKKASLCYFFAGLCSLVSSTWYAIDVMRSVWGDGMAADFSTGIFLGWGASGMAFAATACLFLGRIAMRSEEDPYEVSTNVLNSTNSADKTQNASGSSPSNPQQNYNNQLNNHKTNVMNNSGQDKYAYI